MGAFVERSGQRYGKLLVLERAPDRPRASQHGSRTFWLCRCDCGREVQVDSGSLATRNTSGCRWCGGSKSEAGKRYGRLVVVRSVLKNTDDRYPTPPFKMRKQGTQWLCLCDCGTEIITRGSNLRRGESKSCGCVATEKLRARTMLPNGVAAMRAIIHRTKRNAAERGYEFALPQEMVRSLMAGTCHYCGAPPSNLNRHPDLNGSFTYSGIDRVDNEQGYVPGNVVSCCKHCNISKRDRSTKEFLDWIAAVHSYQSRRVAN